MINALRGEFAALLAGESHAFDTTLATIAAIEDACDGRSIMEIVNSVVVGRRAADQIALLAAALRAAGRAPTEATGLARRTTVPEAEAFILALMGALGFKVARSGEGEAAGHAPLAGTPAGASGGSSPSAV